MTVPVQERKSLDEPPEPTVNILMIVRRSMPIMLVMHIFHVIVLLMGVVLFRALIACMH